MKIAAPLFLLASLSLCSVARSFAQGLPEELEANVRRLSAESGKEVFYSYSSNEAGNFVYSDIAPLTTGERERVAYKDGFLVISDRGHVQVIRVAGRFEYDLSRQATHFEKWPRILDLYSRRTQPQGTPADKLLLSSLPTGSTKFIQELFGNSLNLSNGRTTLLELVNIFPQKVMLPLSVQEYVVVFDTPANKVAMFPLDRIAISQEPGESKDVRPARPLNFEGPGLDLTSPESSLPANVTVDQAKVGQVLDVASLARWFKEAGASITFDAASGNRHIAKAHNGEMVPVNLQRDWKYVLSSAELRETSPQTPNTISYSRKAFRSYYEQRLNLDLLQGFLPILQQTFPGRMQLNINSLVIGRRKWTQLSAAEKEVLLSHLSGQRAGDLQVSREELENNPDLLIEFGLDAHLGALYYEAGQPSFGSYTINDQLSFDN